ncbi:Hypothetical protein I596_2155 [Dokdonella koreensis DS-123]|uniref:Uncharacterized protein n=1 Tax=Dokdonella koreensis DS-123 TaxID=1300342 RepID=A0A160DUK5_9GAMM|nr:Hypothetical protein I596_2155 [Dokdonella koreensis DS-123]
MRRPGAAPGTAWDPPRARSATRPQRRTPSASPQLDAPGAHRPLRPRAVAARHSPRRAR